MESRCDSVLLRVTKDRSCRPRGSCLLKDAWVKRRSWNCSFHVVGFIVLPFGGSSSDLSEEPFLLLLYVLMNLEVSSCRGVKGSCSRNLC